MLAYTVIVPIMPFVIDGLQNNGSVELRSKDHSALSNEGILSKDTGILLAFFSIGLLVGSPILGYLADRMKHRQWLMMVGILGLLTAMLLFLFATAYWQLLIARLLQGFSDACVWTLGLCLIADTFPLEELGSQMGKVLLFHSIGVVSGSPIGAGIDLFLRLLLIERRHRPAEWFDLPANTEPIQEKGPKNQITVVQLLRQHRLLAALLLAFANGCVGNVFEPTLTIRLSNEWGYNASQIGLVFLAQVAPTFLATPMAGWLADKVGAKLVCAVSLTVCAISVYLMALPNRSTGIGPLIFLFALQGFSSFASLTPVLSEMAHVVNKLNRQKGDAGQAMSYALFNMAYASGCLIGPLLGGYVYSQLGFFYLCMILGSLLMLCVPFILLFTGK
ncbi:major facilitator superfamily domain-containing protein [Blakeslea trispora]|nr:major facilitator superfamily domain-containing protein [Blakeslea trispora]